MRSIQRSLSGSAALIFCLTLPVLAQTPPDVKALLQQVRERYRNLSSYHFEYTVSSDYSDEGHGLRTESKRQEWFNLWFAKPAKVRVEARQANTDIVRIDDGQTVWLFAPGLNAYAQRPRALAEQISRGYSRDFMEEYQFSTVLNQANWLFDEYRDLLSRPTYPQVSLGRDEVIEVGGQKIACYVFELRRAEPGNLRRLWIDRQRLMVVRDVAESSFENQQGGRGVSRRAVEFKAVQVDEILPDTLFSFTAPVDAVRVYKLNPYDQSRLSLVGKPAPDFTLKDLAGRTVNLRALRGKAVLLNFWATWCGPCIAEMPELEKLQQEYKDKDVAFLFVDDEEPDKPRTFLQEKHYSFGSLVDEERKVFTQYRVGGIPQTFLIDKQGQLRAQLTGTRGEAEFRAALEAARNDVPVARAVPSADPALSAVYQDFLGAWQSAAQPSRLHRVRVQLAGGRLTMQVSDCASLGCDWGSTEARPFRSAYNAAATERPQLLQASFTAGSATREVLLFAEGSERLRAELLETTGDGRAARAVMFLEREKALLTTAALVAPKLLAPDPGSVFTHYPRAVALSWEAVPNAAGYRVELDFGLPGQGVWHSEQSGRNDWVVTTTTPGYSFDFTGAQPGRWRAWAVDTRGLAGAKSEWREFSFTK